MRYIAFEGDQRLASGPLAEVALAVMKASRAPPRSVDHHLRRCQQRARSIDFRGSERDIVARLPQRRSDPESRPKTSRCRSRAGPAVRDSGVVAREVTLLPRHWEWLGRQPGGASVALRKLVEAARRASGDLDRIRAQDAAYHFMSAMAGNCRISRKPRGRCSPMIDGGLSR